MRARTSRRMKRSLARSTTTCRISRRKKTTSGATGRRRRRPAVDDITERLPAPTCRGVRVDMLHGRHQGALCVCVVWVSECALRCAVTRM
eukprot:3687801-Prymnesium_polylepis.1